MKAKDRGELVKLLSKSHVLVGADLDFSLVKDIDADLIVSKLMEANSNGGPLILNRMAAERISAEMQSDKAPKPIEVMRPTSYKPAAAEVHAEFKIQNTEIERVEGSVKDFVDHFNDRLNRIRALLSTSVSVQGLMADIESLSKMTTGREVVIIGMVSNKITTKNGNIMVTLEDPTADTKLIFMNGSSDQAKSLFIKASTIMNDEVIVVKGKVSMPFVMVKELIWPDIPIKIPKTTEDDIGIAFISDTQAGSKLFMERNFSAMIRWLNGESDKHRELAGKIKYLILGGDVVDGVGVYPNQERNLSILDVYAQYKMIFNMLEAVPDHIEIFIMPGNHDSVQLSEPQPMLSKELVGDFKRDNVHFLTNPSYVTLHGLDVLCYHGTSLDSIIRSVPNMSYAKPETAMIELMKRRHLSPIHGGVSIVPTKKDYLVVEKVPDIVHMGHVHKNGLDNYHGVDIVNSGTWQDQTDYQLRQGHIPSPCLVPVLETKKHAFKIVDFNMG